MKKALKIAGIAVGSIVVLILIAVAYFQFKGVPTYTVEAPELTVEADSALLARGEYLTGMTCVVCHRGEDGKLSGKLMEENSGFGAIYAPNITQHPEAGIGRYSDGELAYLLRTGIRSDGKQTLPVMPRLHAVSDEDVKAIIAYLRSDAFMVQPSDARQPAYEPTFLAKMLMTLVFKPIPYPVEPQIAPPSSDPVAYGEYLATNVIQCYHCHSASFEKADLVVPEHSEGFFGGGNLINNPAEPDKPVLSSNLTPHSEYGIGKWTKEEFAQAVRFGKRPDGTSLSPAMPMFTHMTEEDAHAIFAYLQTIPEIGQPVAQAGK